MDYDGPVCREDRAGSLACSASLSHHPLRLDPRAVSVQPVFETLRIHCPARVTTTRILLERFPGVLLIISNIGTAGRFSAAEARERDCAIS